MTDQRIAQLTSQGFTPTGDGLGVLFEKDGLYYDISTDTQHYIDERGRRWEYRDGSWVHEGVGGSADNPHIAAVRASREAFAATLEHVGGDIYKNEDGHFYRKTASGRMVPVVLNLSYDPESDAPAFLDVDSALATSQGSGQVAHHEAAGDGAALQEHVDELELSGASGDPLLSTVYTAQAQQRARERYAAFEATLEHVGSDIYRNEHGHYRKTGDGGYAGVVMNLGYDADPEQEEAFFGRERRGRGPAAGAAGCCASAAAGSGVQRRPCEP